MIRQVGLSFLESLKTQNLLVFSNFTIEIYSFFQLSSLSLEKSSQKNLRQIESFGFDRV